jgi:hypothetical protein
MAMSLKIYNRLDGIPEEHKWVLIEVLSYADQGGARYEDRILVSCETKEELQNYCNFHRIQAHVPGEPAGWDLHKIVERTCVS